MAAAGGVCFTSENHIPSLVVTEWNTPGRWRELFLNALVLVGWIWGPAGTLSSQRWGTGGMGITAPQGLAGEIA